MHFQSDDSRQKLYEGNRPIQSVACNAEGSFVFFAMKSGSSSSSTYEIYAYTEGLPNPLRFTLNNTDDINVSMSSFGDRIAWQSELAGTSFVNYIEPIEDGYKQVSIFSSSPQNYPSLSGDGNYMALIRQLNSNYRVMVLNLTSFTYTSVFTSRAMLTDPSLSNEATKVAWLQTTNTRKLARVKDLNSNAISNIHSHSSLEHPMLSSTGGFISFARNYRGAQHIYTKDLNSGQLKRISANTSGNYLQAFWQWSDIINITLDYQSPELQMLAGQVARFGFSLAQDAAIIADVDAASLGSSFSDPMLGLFDSFGNLIAFSDDANGLDPQIIAQLPAGNYILAVTGCCDITFNGSHSYSGPYYLKVMQDSLSASIAGAVDTTKVYNPVPAGVSEKNPEFALGELIVKFSPV
ncbi:MAG: DVUA0089 family protein [Deinococcales bacterium]